MGNLFGACNIYVTQETKSNEIRRDEETPSPTKSKQSNPPARLSYSGNTYTRNLSFIHNDTAVAVNSLCSPAFYLKMTQGNSMTQLQEPLNDFFNTKLKEIAAKIITVTSELFSINAAFLLNNYKDNLVPLIDSMKVLTFQQEDNETIKKALLEMIANLTELYQFFKHSIANLKEPYDNNYWNDTKNVNDHILKKISLACEQLKNIESIHA